MPKGLMVAIGLPKHGGGGDIGDLDGIDSAPGGKMPQHEAAETSEYEASEEYGAKLVKDVEAAGRKHGLQPDAARMAFADMMRAAADCLSGGGDEESSEGQQPPVEEEGEGEMPMQRGGGRSMYGQEEQ